MIKANRKALISALGRCSRVAQARAPQPILSHTLVEFSGDRLQYRATNVGLTVAGAIMASGDPAAFTVNPRDFADRLGALEGEETKIEVGAGFIRLSSTTKRSFKVPTLPADEFPKVPEVDGAEVSLPVETLLGLVRGVTFAVAPDTDDREQLRAIRVFSKGAELVALSGNGRCAARACTKSTASLDVVIPSSACRMLLESVDGAGDMTVQAGRLLRFAWAEESLTAAPPAAKFPVIEAALSQRPPSTAKFNSDELAAAVAAVQRVDAERDVVLTFKPGALTVESHGAGHGYAFDEVAVEYDGATAQVALSAQYLSDALAAAGDEVTAYFDSESFDPFVLESEGWVGIVMPLRLQTLRDKGKL